MRSKRMRCRVRNGSGAGGRSRILAGIDSASVSKTLPGHLALPSLCPNRILGKSTPREEPMPNIPDDIFTEPDDFSPVGGEFVV